MQAPEMKTQTNRQTKTNTKARTKAKAKARTKTQTQPIKSMLLLVILAAIPLAAEEAPRVEPPPAEKIARILPGLSSVTAAEVERANSELESLCFSAGRPGAESERKAVALAIVAQLTPEVPVAAEILLVEALAKIGKGEAVPALGQLLAPDVDPLLGDAARRALEANPHVNAKKELRAALRGAKGTLRIGIINSLGARRDFLASADLMEFAQDPDVELRLAALEALAQIGDVAAAPVLEAGLKDLEGTALSRVQSAYLRLADSLVRNNERGTARRIYDKAMGMGPSLRAAALMGFARAGLQMETDRILESIDDPDHRVRGAALEAAAILPGEAVTRGLLKRLDGVKEAEGRIRLLDVLARRGDEQASSRILKSAAEEAEPAVRAAAIRLLEGGAAGGGEVTSICLSALRSSGDPSVAAEDVLSRIPGEGATESVAAAFRGETDPGLRESLVRVLGARRDAKGLETIHGALKDPTAGVRVASLRAVGLIGDPSSVPALLDALRKGTEPERDAASSSLAVVGGEATAKRLLEAAGTEKGAARAALLRVVALRKEKGTLGLFLAAAADADPEVRLAGIEGLAAADDPAALSVLMDEADKGTGTLQTVAVRGCLRFAEALAREKREDAAKIYLKALGVCRGDDELRTALHGLGEVGGPEVLDAIVPFLKSGPVQRGAGSAALRIAERLPEGKQAGARELYARILSLDVDDATAARCVRRLRRLGVDVDFAHESGFVTAWWILGPIPSPGGSLWDKALPPESGADTAKEVSWEGKSYRWTFFHNPHPRGLVHLDQIEGFAADSAMAYLYAEVTLPADTDALFKIGSDDQVACWLDDQKIHANKVNRGLAPDQDLVKVKLAKGTSRILVKVLNDSGPWGACLRITDRSGKPLEFTQRMGK